MNPDRRRAIRVAGATLAVVAGGTAAAGGDPPKPADPGPAVALAGSVLPDWGAKDRDEKPIVTGTGFKAAPWSRGEGEERTYGWQVTYDKPLPRPPVVTISCFSDRPATDGQVHLGGVSKGGFTVICNNRLGWRCGFTFAVFLP